MSMRFPASLFNTETNECASNPCLQASTCIDLLDDYECICEMGYEGQNCEKGKTTN